MEEFRTMKGSMDMDHRTLKIKTVPSLAEFQSWSCNAVADASSAETIILAIGGTSRWYFLEHGDAAKGYDQREQFDDYSQKLFNRVMEIAAMMFADGVQVLFLISLIENTFWRNSTYVANAMRGIAMSADRSALDLYEKLGVRVEFRGAWRRLLHQGGADDVYRMTQDAEKQTAQNRGPLLIWTMAADSLIPSSLTSSIKSHLDQTGQLPSREQLIEAYYGQLIQPVDILISNNKPTIGGQIPPLVEVNDLYFTVCPCVSMGQRQWRSILYDHLFSRCSQARDYTAVKTDGFAELRAFYEVNRGNTLGLGQQHEATRTWRPTPQVIDRLKELP